MFLNTILLEKWVVAHSGYTTADYKCGRKQWNCYLSSICGPLIEGQMNVPAINISLPSGKVIGVNISMQCKRIQMLRYCLPVGNVWLQLGIPLTSRPVTSVNPLLSVTGFPTNINRKVIYDIKRSAFPVIDKVKGNKCTMYYITQCCCEKMSILLSSELQYFIEYDIIIMM